MLNLAYELNPKILWVFFSFAHVLFKGEGTLIKLFMILDNVDGDLSPRLKIMAILF